MERRVRLVVGLLLLAALVSLSVPLAVTLADRRTTRLAAERDRQLAVLAERAVAGTTEARRYHEVYGEPVAVVDAEGMVLASAGGLDPTDPDVTEAVRVGLVGQPSAPLDRVLPWTSADPLRAATASEDGEIVALAVTRVDTGRAAADVRRAWALLVLGCLALVLLAAGGTRWLSRWTVRPVHSLEEAARAIAHGDRGDVVLATGPPELRELVTEFNRMVEVVQRSLDHQRRLVADASHQLRNPLTAVRLRADALGGHVTEAGARTHAGLTAELDRLERLLDQLMLLARAQEQTTAHRAGAATDVDLAPIDDVVTGRVAAWLPLAAAAGQRLELGGPLPATGVDRSDLEQVLDVALDNAIRYAGDGAHVVVSASDGGPAGVVVSVTDDGPGLPAGTWERATERFWRGNGDRPGSGLGLSIAHEIATRHGGWLGVRPRSGGGTVVEFSLPGPTTATGDDR
jgi:signal transduction histidine kinase